MLGEDFLIKIPTLSLGIFEKNLHFLQRPGVYNVAFFGPTVASRYTTTRSLKPRGFNISTPGQQPFSRPLSRLALEEQALA